MLRFVTLISVLSCAVSAATLQKLSLDEMIAQSADIVRGKVVSASASFRGTASRSGMIYTHYTVSVIERYKGTAGSTIDVAIPGGTAQGYRQVFAGSPVLNPGDEFVFLLWTSRSGLTQIIGLTQGMFTLSARINGKQVLSRSASPEVMINPATGQPSADSGMTITLDDLKRRIGGFNPSGKVTQ